MLKALSTAWFRLKTLAIRGRFLLGKASFVAAEIHSADHQVQGERLLSHYEVQTRKPRTGSQGWYLFEARFAPAPEDHPTALECGYCGHLFVIDVSPSSNPLSAALGSRRGGAPASYASDWFRFPGDGGRREAVLSCGRCEQRGRPRVLELA